MADLFDLANLITTVGVDAVKIKPEPGLPQKSSNEILTELFSTFDADADDSEESSNEDDDSNSTPKNDKDKSVEKTSSKKKKSKKKHKHKDKKHKHKSKKHSSDSDSGAENGGSKKKKKKKKKHKRSSSLLKLNIKEEPGSKKRKLSKDGKLDGIHSENNEVKVKIEKKVDGEIDNLNEFTDKENKEKVESTSLPKVFNDDAVDVPKFYEKSKSSTLGKIQIKDLKNSEVYSKTVEEVENKIKEKADKMEDGEISDESESDPNKTPSLSPSPNRESGLYSDKIKRSRSPKSRLKSDSHDKKNDLRLILKEKEKNKSSSKRDHSHTRSRSQNRSQRHSRSSDRSRKREKSRETYWDRGRRRHSRDGYRGRSRSRSKHRKERIEIDKKKLLEIARRNAINMIKKGKLPLAQQDKAIAAIQAGGKTIEELTDFCKTLSKSEAMGELSSISSEDGSDSDKGFHHPFIVKDRPSSIIMNIRDSKQIPTKSFLEKATDPNNLRLQFPVSSGQQHRKNEGEWVPVVKPKPKPEPKKKFIPAKETFHTIPETLVVPPLPVEPAVTDPMLMQATNNVMGTYDYQANVGAIPGTSVQPAMQESVFPVPPAEPIDISSIVSQRLAAMRKLSENPNDVQALSEMYKAQNGMKSWVESKQIPGQFTGSTGAKLLSAAELSSGYQAWARKDQLVSAQPVSGGMGMALLQKMGWNPGEGLGKNKEGTLIPLQLELKLDRKGLVSDQDVGAEKFKKSSKAPPATIKTLEGKHPVSLLGEYCSKRKFGAPQYELCFECGPDHKKNFVFKVKVNGVEYKPSVACPNKKLAKAEAAQVCLQSIGLLPS